MRFFHSGDLGDIVYALPSMRTLCERDGSKAFLYLGDRDWTRSRWSPSLLSVIEPFLISQDFIEEVILLPRNEIPAIPFTDFSCFRNGGYLLGDSIYERQRRWVQADADISGPWLQSDRLISRKILINRTSRWHGIGFPWKELLARFPTQAVFIGLGQEHEAFVQEFGEIPFVPTKNLLEAARLISGCSFFIGNQSVLGAIANGFFTPQLTEVCLYAPDCFLPRENAFYCLDGALDLEICGIPIQTPAYAPSPGSSPRWQEEMFERDLFLARARKAFAISLQRNSCAVA